MKALVGRIVCDAGGFAQEFLELNVMAPTAFSWSREKEKAHDFRSASVARAIAMQHAYNEKPSGRLRVPWVITDAIPPDAPRSCRAHRARPAPHAKTWRGSLRARLVAMEARHPHEEVFADLERRHLA